METNDFYKFSCINIANQLERHGLSNIVARWNAFCSSTESTESFSEDNKTITFEKYTAARQIIPRVVINTEHSQIIYTGLTKVSKSV